MIRFLHAADLHLGSALSGRSAGEAALFRDRQFQAVRALFSDGVARGAQLLLLAGDVFDSPNVSKDVTARFFEMLGELPVPVLIAPGNHDFWTENGVYRREDLPPNVYVFDTPRLACFDFAALGVAVYGYAFLSERCATPDLGDAADLPTDRVSLLVGHADLTSPLSAYAPISAGQLERAGFAYAALGHIHNAPPARRYGNTVAAYSGFLAGRGFDEPGAGGALFVEIEGRHVEMTRLESAADRFEVLSVDCTGAQKNEEVAERVRKSLSEQEFLPHTALRLRLIGEVGLSCVPDGRLPADLREGFSLLEVRDETLPILDSGYLEKDPTLRGAFYRAMLPRLTATDDETRMIAARAFRMGLAALAGREV
jgi:DNA repair exonuclease SbcCD nuclease subunit